MAKEFRYRGLTVEELKKMDIKDFAKLLPARERRTLTRGMSHPNEILIKDVRAKKANIKTQCRDAIIIPEMVATTIQIYDGKSWIRTLIEPDMIGHRLGEFALTRKKVQHSAPGIGATRSSAALSVK